MAAWITTGQLAKELSVSPSTILNWLAKGWITPEYTTPGRRHRWDLDNVRAQLNAQQSARIKDE